MQIPFIKYIEGLIASRMPIDDVYDAINKLGVPLATLFPREAILQVYNKIFISAEDYFRGRNVVPNPEWLKDLEIYKLVAHLLKLQIPETTIGIEGAMEIVKDRNMYEIMTSLALAKVNDEDIELIINGKYNIHYTSEDIKEFLHYFFNVEGWTLTQKKEYVSVVTETNLKKLYKIALEGDKDYLIWKLGIAPEKSFDTMLRDMAMDSYYIFKEKRVSNPDEAQKWGQLYDRFMSRLDKIEKDAEDRKDLFTQMTIVLAGKTEDDLKENYIDGTGTVRVQKKSKPRHISEILDD